MTTRTAEFYSQNETGFDVNQRLNVMLDAYREHRRKLGRQASVLDVGCGHHAVLVPHLEPGDTYVGTDIVESIEVDVPRYYQVDLNTQSIAEEVEDGPFDVIFCGEVIEHVFSPDALLEELRALMHEDSLLILSTPNLAYWVNRILLPLGINPLFVENSAWIKLGRRWKFLGQGNETQGHLRLFTHRAMLDLLKLRNVPVYGVRASMVWNFPPDRLICRFSNKLAPDNVYLLGRGEPASQRIG